LTFKTGLVNVNKSKGGYMSKTVTVVMNDETYKLFKKMKTEFKASGMTVTELFRQMILKFAEGRK